MRNSAIMVASAGRERVRVQQHHHRPVAAAAGVHEAGGRRPLELHPRTSSPVPIETAHRLCLAVVVTVLAPARRLR